TTPIIFFRDDNTVSGEDAAGAIRYLSLKPLVATDAEVLNTWNNICNITSCVPPVLTCPPDVSVNVESGQCLALVNYDPATASGATESITYSQNPNTYFPIGTTVVTAT
ncbi:HYR domain-containing protein, partial [Arthrospira platensis SPKY1]|nr:HYR domain-containing protein [Arthrospira platensis SPKY1]